VSGAKPRGKESRRRREIPFRTREDGCSGRAACFSPRRVAPRRPPGQGRRRRPGATAVVQDCLRDSVGDEPTVRQDDLLESFENLPEPHILPERDFQIVPRSQMDSPPAQRAVTSLSVRNYTDHPVYGSRRLQVTLLREGVSVGRRRVRRLMRKLGLPQPRQTRPASRSDRNFRSADR
jgi:HTH-like domain